MRKVLRSLSLLMPTFRKHYSLHQSEKQPDELYQYRINNGSRHGDFLALFSLLLLFFFLSNSNFTKERRIYEHIWTYFVYNYIYLYMFIYILIC